MSEELKELQVLQNDMVRIITGHKRSDRVNMNELRKSIKMMSVNQMACYHIILDTYNIIHYSSCEELRAKFTTSISKSLLQTRSEARGDLLVPKVEKKSCVGFSYFAARLWNCLSTSTRSLNSDKDFKMAVKERIRNGSMPPC